MHMRKSFIAMAVTAAMLVGAVPVSTFWSVGAMESPAPPVPSYGSASEAAARDLTVLTYNVHGLPWPFARNRSSALVEIGSRLQAMRAAGTQPHVVLLQEAFTGDAKRVAEKAGYAYVVDGPSRKLAAPVFAKAGPGALFAAGASWFKGETQGKLLDSGLRILSDYPVLKVSRAAFPADACAGFDCLANKGVVMATLAVPGPLGRTTPIAVATTHLNSGRASGVDKARAMEAYRRQLTVLDRFFAAHREPGVPLIFAGDFNAGRRPARRELLLAHSAVWWGENMSVALRDVAQPASQEIGRAHV